MKYYWLATGDEMLDSLGKELEKIVQRPRIAQTKASRVRKYREFLAWASKNGLKCLKDVSDDYIFSYGQHLKDERILDYEEIRKRLCIIRWMHSYTPRTRRKLASPIMIYRVLKI